MFLHEIGKTLGIGGWIDDEGFFYPYVATLGLTGGDVVGRRARYKMWGGIGKGRIAMTLPQAEGR